MIMGMLKLYFLKFLVSIERGRAMSQVVKAKVFMNGRSQAVRIPAEYRLTADEVYIRRDPKSGNLVLSEAPCGWDEIFAALDEAGVPEDFLADRNQGIPRKRVERHD
jgi:antitoxin VapB